MKKTIFAVLIGLIFLTAACSSEVDNPEDGATIVNSPTSTDQINSAATPSSSPAATATETPQAAAVEETATRPPQSTPSATTSSTSTALPTATRTLGPDGWKELPVIPTVSETVYRIYQRGLELGNNRHAFSKIGDCGGTPAWFLGDFDRGDEFYRLGEYQELEQVIDYYQGSFGRTSLAARSSFNASSVFTQIWADPEYCLSEETPLACEYRINRPMIAIIALGTNDVYHPDKFEPQMRRIIETSIENGIIPVLATKADNLEGDGSINDTISRLALEYDIPLWNYWRAVQQLPAQGLQEDGAHLTWARNWFDDPQALKSGWTVRNLTALQVLDAVWRGLAEHQRGD